MMARKRKLQELDPQSDGFLDKGVWFGPLADFPKDLLVRLHEQSLQLLMEANNVIERDQQKRLDKRERELRSPRVRSKILKALENGRALKARTLATQAGQKNNSRFRAVLARMVTDKLLTNEEGRYQMTLSRP